MRRNLRSQKAVSPTAAVLIIIAVAVVMSIAVATWMGALTFTWTGKEKAHGVFVGKLTAYEYRENSPECITLHFGSVAWFYKGDLRFDIGKVYEVHYTAGTSYIDNVAEVKGEETAK